MILEILNKIFLDNEELMNFLLFYEIVPLYKLCRKCGQQNILSIYKREENKHLGYRCKEKSCRDRNPLYRTNISLHKYVHILYLLMSGSSYKQLNIWYSLPNTTIHRIKSVLRDAYKKYMQRRHIILGNNARKVQVDETVLSRRGIIRNPTTTDDYYADTVWIVGAIDTTDKRKFFLKRVENRQANTLTDVLKDVICPGSILVTDGYPSYPSVASQLNLDHIIVNHSAGFRTESGDHTNNIEAFWSDLKGTMRRENGVKRENIDVWLEEYSFKRSYLMEITSEEFTNLFIEILKIILK